MQHSLRQFLGILTLLVGIILSPISCGNPSAKRPKTKHKPSKEELKKIFSEEIMKLVPPHLKDAVTAVKNGERDINELFLEDSAGVFGEKGKTTLLSRILRLRRDPSIGEEPISNKLIEALIEAGADPNQKDEMGQTAMHCAETPELIQLLYDAGAKLDVRDKIGQTPLRFHTRLLHGLRDEAVGKLLALGAHPDIPDNKGSTPLHKAASSFSDKQVEMLLEAGAPVDPLNSKGVTPLGMAAETGCYYIVDFLLGKNADPNGGSFSPLHCAADFSGYRSDYKAKAAESLIKAGADINKSLEETHYTPLHIASRSNEKKVAEVLLSAGATVNAKDHKGLTPLKHAKKRKHKEMVDLLTRYNAS